MAIRPITSISFCSGIGGLDLGVSAALAGRLHTLVYVEGEVFCADILAARGREGRICHAPIWSNLLTFDPKPYRGQVDIITAGYPCQPFSQAGKRRGEKDPRHLWPYIASHIDVIRPGFVFCENVPGHLTLGFEQVCCDLSAMGYKIEAGIFSAAEVGAPHLRKRLFFLAHADSNGLRHQPDTQPWCQNTTVLADDVKMGPVADADDAIGRRVSAQRCNMENQDGRVHKRRPETADNAAKSCADVADAKVDGRTPRGGNRLGIEQAGTKRFSARTLGAPQPSGPQHGLLSDRVREQNWAHAREQRPARLGGPRWETMSGLCGGHHAHAHRVDRLRALGNAVVPACATKAFAELYAQISV